MISLLPLNNFYPVISSYRRVQEKKKATNYCIRFGHSLWSANQLPAQRVERARICEQENGHLRDAVFHI